MPAHPRSRRTHTFRKPVDALVVLRHVLSRESNAPVNYSALSADPVYPIDRREVDYYLTVFVRLGWLSPWDYSPRLPPGEMEARIMRG